MKKEALSLFGQPDLILFAFLLFFFSFLGLCYWAYHRANREHFDKMSQLPLSNNEVNNESR